METRFSPLLVTLSVVVAIFASYVALNLAHSVTQSRGRARALWLSCGALAMGIGIWSMHFVGMLAFEMPGMAMAYDVPLMLLSVAVAIGASALALFIISRPVVPSGSIVSGGVTMAAAIAGMHYIGMYSMRMAAEIRWNVFLVVLSVIIALVASWGALWILTRLRNKADHQLEMCMAAAVMGIAISGMHYTGMLAATFIHVPDSAIKSSHLLVTSGLSMAVISTTSAILILALASSVGQRLWLMRSRKAAEVLVNSEEKFRRLVEAVKDYAIFMLDPNGLITTWNLGAERINGYTEKEVLGKPVSLFYTPEDIENETAKAELEAAVKFGHFESEGRRIRKDGSEYWASVVIVPVYVEGKITGFSKVIRDITEVKRNELRLRQVNEELEKRVKLRTRALEQSENQLRNITNALPVLIAQMDHTERFLFANEAFCTWFGRTPEEVVGREFFELLGPVRYPANEPFIKRALAGELVTYERRSAGAGRTAMLSVTFVPEFGESGVSGVIVLATDITKHKEIEAELNKAKEAAEVANATKSAFLANMSHEIRTPLGAVLGFSELLLDGQMSPSERQNSVEVIKRNGRLLSNIINDILDLSKVEAGKLDVELTDVSFNELMREIGSVLGLEAAEKGIELKVATEGVVPGHLRTDSLRLRQILLNIVGNAIKFTSHGSVDIRIKLVPAEGGSPKLAFIVKDTGEGIPAAQAARLFTPFTQADPSTTRKFGGTGLGLVLSKKLAQALGGDVVLTETEPGHGSTFVVTIDPGVPEQVLFQSGVAESPQPIRLPEVRRGINLSLLRVLVVDDSMDNQALIKKILKLAGATVETANNGKEAIEKALNGDFSLVLMDLQMPVMDGYEATKILRQRGFKKPIIALTAHAMKEERQRSLRSGFDDHITKPIDHEFLVKTLAEYTA